MNSVGNFVTSTYFVGLLSIFVTVYGPRLSPKLPDGIRNLFHSHVFRALVMFLVLISCDNNMGVVMAISIVVIFMVLMNAVQTYNLLESFGQENFAGSRHGRPVADLDNYDMEQGKYAGTAWYPLSERNNHLDGEPLYEPNLSYKISKNGNSNNQNMAVVAANNSSPELFNEVF